jgi:hypothetical protein
MKPNFTCKVCGKEYYCCKEGVTKFPFLRIVCSKACYDEWKKAIAARKNKSSKKTSSVTKKEVSTPKVIEDKE